MIPNYGKIVPLRHDRYGHDLFDRTVVLQEKIDGSQVSFALERVECDPLEFYDVPVVRSKNQVVQDGNKMFQMVLDWVQDNHHLLNPDYIYRGEAVTSLKHNTLTYGRVPVGGVILFDIQDRHNDRMLTPFELHAEANHIGLECVPTLYAHFNHGFDIAVKELQDRLDTESCLGGCKVEGFVIKRYDLPDPQAFADTRTAGGFLKVKLVSDAFKEVHHKDWKGRNPNSKDFIANMVEVYGTDARLQKAVQHLREEGKLTDEPKDIGLLMGEVARDVTEECKAEILNALWKQYGKTIIAGISKRMPDYYKKEVLGIV